MTPSVTSSGVAGDRHPVFAEEMELRLKRAYDTAESSDGYRVLVDRLWPRGLSKERASIDLWAKDTAPSTELRRDWHAAPDSEWDVFADRYRAQLAQESAKALQELGEELRRHPVVTLVHAVHDAQHNHAVILAEALRAQLGE